jgi:hypothetical protein
MRSKAGNDSRYLYISTTPGVCSPHSQLARHALGMTCFSSEESKARYTRHTIVYERHESGDLMSSETGTACQLVLKSNGTLCGLEGKSRTRARGICTSCPKVYVRWWCPAYGFSIGTVYRDGRPRIIKVFVILSSNHDTSLYRRMTLVSIDRSWQCMRLRRDMQTYGLASAFVLELDDSSPGFSACLVDSSRLVAVAGTEIPRRPQ